MMKSNKTFLFWFFLLVFLLPALLLPTVKQYIEEEAVAEPVFFSQEESHTILVSMGGQLQEMDLEQYVVGVVLAEMPADFDWL